MILDLVKGFKVEFINIEDSNAHRKSMSLSEVHLANIK